MVTVRPFPERLDEQMTFRKLREYACRFISIKLADKLQRKRREDGEG